MASRRSTPGMLSVQELNDTMASFEVAEHQVRRDHVISYALAALASIDNRRLLFFGGTALARTHLPDLRLSEDIDLIALSPRTVLADDIQRALVSGLSRVVGAPEFAPDIGATINSQACVMRVDDVQIQIQLLAGLGYPGWPTEVRALEQRYSDAPPAVMRVLTASAFAAAKLAAWHDRRAPRDLYDMWALGRRGLITDDARRIYAKFGPTTSAAGVVFAPVPSQREWQDALGHQGVIKVTAAEAASTVAEEWSGRT